MNSSEGRRWKQESDRSYGANGPLHALSIAVRTTRVETAAEVESHDRRQGAVERKAARLV
jgi:hypothetical protein